MDPTAPSVAAWHITDNGTVRGQLLLSDRLLDTAIAAVEAVHQQYPGSTVISRAALAGTQELVVCLTFEVWDVEFWVRIAHPSA